MTLETLQALLKEVIEDHKAGLTFFTGLKKDFDPANERSYPSVFVQPVTKLRGLSPDGHYVITWTINMLMVDSLPEDRTSDDINEALQRFDRVTDAVIFKLYEFGYDETDFTVNNVTTRMDFQIPAPIVSDAVVDEGDSNLTGWLSVFTIVEPVDGSTIACCLADNYK